MTTNRKKPCKKLLLSLGSLFSPHYQAYQQYHFPKHEKKHEDFSIVYSNALFLQHFPLDFTLRILFREMSKTVIENPRQKEIEKLRKR